MGGIAGNDDNRKQNHCEIEKRRRDKMNHYITELASVIPAFNNNQSRLDKLTVLRMAVQHVKSLRSSLCSFSSYHLRPSFLSSGNLLKNLILQMASQEAQDNLFMVVTCDRGKVLFVSKSSKDILNQDQSELVGKSLFDILHKDDVSKVKEQISHFNLTPKEMLVDSRTLQPIKSNQRESFIQLQNQLTSKTLQPGSRRSFFCRMNGYNAERSKQTVEGGGTNGDLCVKRASSRESSISTTTGNTSNQRKQSSSGSAVKGGSDSNGLGSNSTNGAQTNSGFYNSKQWRYIVMHCSGYLKAITLRNDEYDDDEFDQKTSSYSSTDSDSDDNLNDDDDDDDGKEDTENKVDSNFRTVNCLVAVCRRSVLDRDLRPNRPLTFTCRYSMEGKFTFVDQRTTVALGYTPQQLIGTSHYAYCHKDSVNTFKECHRQCILEPDTVSSDIYQFKRANGQHLWLQTSLKSFRNPWTKFIDYIVANHTTAEGSDPRYNEGCVPTKFNQDMTCEATNSQSSSPCSSSSAPSEECKKSTSPGSSSIGSSYSMDSYASGGSIQALLNQIDRVKSGGLKHSLEFPKKRSGACHNHHQHHHHHHHHDHHHNHHIRHHRRGDPAGSSGGSSGMKSTYDSGNFSDIQSCSSISSQNSSSLTSSGGFTQTVNKFVNQVSDVSPLETQTSETTNDTSITCNQVEQQPNTKGKKTKPAPKLAANSTNDSAGVACMDSTNSYQSGSEKQEQPASADAGFRRVQARPDNSAQQPNFERQQTACQQVVVCPSAPPLQSHPICAQPNFASGTTNMVRSNTNNTRQEQHYINAVSCKTSMGGPRMVTARANRAPSINSTSAIKPLQRPYQYTYRAPQKKSAQLPTESVTVARGASWSNQGGAYPRLSASVNNSVQVIKNQAGNDPVVGGKEQATRQRQHEYLMQQQQQQTTSVNVIQIPQTIQGQSNAGFNTHMTYQNTFTQQPVGPSYIRPAVTVDARYTTVDVSMGHQMSQVQDNSIAPSSMGGQQQQQQQQQQASQQGQQSNDMSAPMIWSSSRGTYPNMMTSSMHIHGQAQMSSCHEVPAGAVGETANMVGLDLAVNQPDQMDIGHHSHCQLCAGHKCCAMNQPMVMASNNCGDFNSMYLSTLAVDDPDESELLECLAACDPDSHMYNMQNNTYSQYNVYRGYQ